MATVATDIVKRRSAMLKPTAEAERIEQLNDPAWVLKTVARATRDAVLDHKRVGNPIALYRDGKVVIVQPEDIVVPYLEDDEAPPSPRKRGNANLDF